MGALHDRGLPRDVLDAHGAAAHFTRAELIAACRAAIDEDFSLETLRDQLAFAAAYPDEAFSRYGARQELIAEVKAWALNWSTEIGLDIAEMAVKRQVCCHRTNLRRRHSRPCMPGKLAMRRAEVRRVAGR
jgi:hypothetical protein